MKRKIFALVDVDNFYVSAQELFDGTIRGRPVVVASNNDSCVIARNRSAKALGVGMGVPLFQIQDVIERYGIAVFSACYALYADLSARIMSVLARFGVAQEIYSIDECWLDLSHVPDGDLETYGREIRRRVYHDVGLVVSVGIATTKVRSKIAVELAKRHGIFQGVVSLVSWSEQDVDGWLRGIAAEDVWGIGKRLGERLRQVGIVSARGLKEADHFWLRHWINVGVQRVVLELRGVSCLPLEEKPRPREGIMVALSFGREIEEHRELEEAVATYAAAVMEKVRRQGSRVGRVSVFIQTNPFDRRVRPYANEASARLPYASANTPDVLDLSLALLGTIYQAGYRYKRAGVYVTELSSQTVLQRDLFGVVTEASTARQERMMALVDEINAQWGRETLRFGSQGTQRTWFMRQSRRSQRFTTRWNELLTIGEESQRCGEKHV